jgi:cytochrome P450
LAAGTDRSLRVPSGAGLLVGTHAAMWDDRTVPDPTDFDPTRPLDHYLIFGGGAHHCLGERIFREQMPALLAPVLKVDSLARAGRLHWSGAQCTDLPLRVA